MTGVALPIAADHPAFAGHFPSRPIVPGVVLLDLALRAIAAARPGAASDATVRIGSAKFVSMVGPGEAVRVEYDESASGAYRVAIFAGVASAERLAVSGVVRFGRD